MMKCPKCGTKNDNDSLFCKKCSTDLSGCVNESSKNNNALVFAIIIASVLLIAIISAIIYLCLSKADHKQSMPDAEQTENTETINEISESQDSTVKYNLYVTNSKGQTILYQDHNTESNKIAELSFGDSCGYIETSQNGFYKIAYNGKIGYVFAEYLSTEKPEVTSTPQAPSTQIMYVVNCNESITLRPSDNVNSGEITQIPLGASVEYLGQANNGFYKIRYNGSVGYALAQYLSKTKQSAATTPSTQIMYVVNCNESITLRPSDNVNSGEITQIPLGASVEYLGQANNGFYKIRYNGSVGYSLSQYLSTSRQPQNTAPTTQTLRVVNCKESITLRPSDNVNSGEITQIPLGATVEYLGQARNGFYRVRYNGAEGYALSQYLK